MNKFVPNSLCLSLVRPSNQTAAPSDDKKGSTASPWQPQAASNTDTQSGVIDYPWYSKQIVINAVSLYNMWVDFKKVILKTSNIKNPEPKFTIINQW